MVAQNQEENLTLEILIDYFNNREKPGQHLKALITISKISIQIETLDYNLPVLELIASFYAKLIEQEDNYLRFSNFFYKELSRYIQRIQDRTNYYYLMDKEKQKKSLQSSKSYFKMDNNTLIMCDLEVITNIFKKTFQNRYEGIFPFNIIENSEIGKHWDIFEGYIIRRIEKELFLIHTEQKFRKPSIQRDYHAPIYITLPFINKTLEQIIAAHLKDLLENSNLDIILIIKYESIDRYKVNYTAQKTLKYVKNNYLHYFSEMRYLIIIFVSLHCECCLDYIDNFIPLPVPKAFEIKPQQKNNFDLENWVKSELLKELEEKQRNLYLDELRNHINNNQGDLIQTYRFLKKMFIFYDG